MWRVRSVVTQSRVMERSGSGQRPLTVTSVKLDEVSFSNALEVVSGDDQGFQLEICECCGCEGCAEGSWVALRRFGDAIGLVPCLGRMEQGAWERNYYRPPDWVGLRGCPLFDAETYAALRRVAPSLPELTAVRPAAMREVVALLQLEAPAGVMGHFLDEPAIDSTAIVAAYEGDVDPLVQATARMARSWWRSEDVAVVREAPTSDDVRRTPVLYVGERRLLEWRPLVLRGDAVALRLEPGLVFEVAADRA